MSSPMFNLEQFLQGEKLKTDGSNFFDWQRNLRILLIPTKMSYVLDVALGDVPAEDSSQDEKNVYQSKVDESTIVKSGMLFAMEAELQKHFEEMSAFKIITTLNAVFVPQARAERNEVLNLFFPAKMEEHNIVSKHVVQKYDCVQRNKTLEYEIPDELAIDRVLQSLPLAINSL